MTERASSPDNPDSRLDPEHFYARRPWEHAYGAGVDPTFRPPADLQTVDDIARVAARRHGDRPAHTVCLDNGMSASLSFSEIDKSADAFAAWLIRDAGVQPGDRVAVQMPNCLAYPVAVFGILRAGAVVVNVNPLYTPHEMQEQLADSGARVLVLMDLFGDKLKTGLRDTEVETTVLAGVADLFPAPRRMLIHTVLRLRKEVPASPRQVERFRHVLARGAQYGLHEFPRRTGNDLALLQYTGGTTGIAKGAELRHRHILANVSQIQAVAGDFIRPGQETVLTALPLYHIFAFTFNFLIFHYNGCRNVLCPSPRPVSKLRKAFEQFPVTIFSGVNLLFHALMQEAWFQAAPPKQIRLSIAGGTALHRSTADRWERMVGTRVLEGYGLTETSPVLAVNPPLGEIRLGSVGVPVPGCDVRILDDFDTPLGPHENGEICARGPQVFEAYRGRPDETRRALRSGYFHTGDIGYMDDDGYVYIVDRKKDMIDVAGFNVFPNEVEECLNAHPDVVEVAVVGAPRGEGGEAVIAFVVAGRDDLSESELLDHARTQLTSYKVPSRIVFREELPKTPVGKLLRRELKDDARKALEGAA